MGVKARTVLECTCDVCGAPCGEHDGNIEIKVNAGDGRDVGAATINGTLRFHQPYGVNGGIVCATCKMEWLKKYLDAILGVAQKE
jgi:hypothetical protein